MTASEFINNRFSFFDELSLAEVIELLQEFAIIQCAEQREICADEVQTLNSGQRIKIQDAPTPKM